MVRILAGFRPAGFSFILQKLLIMSPAPVSRTIAVATSVTTRKLRTLIRRAVADIPYSPSLRALFTLPSQSMNAGARPKSIPVRQAMTSVNRATGKSIRASINRGIACGQVRIMSQIAAFASSNPVCTAKRCEQQTLGNELPSDTHAPSPHGHAQSYLALPGGGTGKQ